MRKVKRFVTFNLFLLALILCANAQKVLEPYYSVDSKLFGFKDSLNSIVIKAQFNAVGPFSEGLAAVNIGGSLEYLDEDEYSFESSQELILTGGKWGYIDEKGSKIIPLKYDEVTNFFQGTAFVKIDTNMGCINKMGVEIIAPKFDMIYQRGNFFEIENEGFYGISDLKGKELLPVRNLSLNLSWDERTILVQTSNQNYGLWDISTKKYIIVPELTDANVINGAKNFIAIKNKEEAVYDFSGALTIPYGRYVSMNYLDSNIIIVSNGIHYGVCDLNEKFIIPFGTYSMMLRETSLISRDSLNESAYNSIYLTYLPVNKDGKWGCLDVLGNTLIEPEYDEIVYYDDIMAALKGNKWTCFDRNNETIISHDTNVFKNNELIYDWEMNTYHASYTVNGNPYSMDMNRKLIEADRDKYFEDVTKAGGVAPKKPPVKQQPK